ncbi:MAG: zinc/iron permease [Pedobacter sp.]|jgi:zinc and cadmium transporter|nr:MAG: zinc/iron permease [Pedobacter sp.]
MEWWKLAILFSSAFLGGLSVFLVKKDNSKLLKLILSFSGAYLFAITVLHLIPHVYETTDPHEIGIFILIGFLLQIFLEQFSQGVEHGHMHHHTHTHQFPIAIVLSLCLHAFLEGMPLVKDQNNELIFGISLHHIPAAFVLAGILKHHHQNRSQIIITLLLFAIMSPAGFFLSHIISRGEIVGMQIYFDKMMGIVIGIFLHISTTILFESSAGHKINKQKMIAVLCGIGVALIGFYSSSH